MTLPSPEAETGKAPAPRERRLPILAAALLVCLAVAWAYAGSLHGPFVLDDVEAIAENPTIRALWPPPPLVLPPELRGSLNGRPLLGFSFAVNYALGGLDVFGYHLANLAIHLLAALALFGVVHRTLQSPPLRERFGPHALPLPGWSPSSGASTRSPPRPSPTSSSGRSRWPPSSSC